MSSDRNARTLIASGVMLGLGLGGFFDAIVFRLLLQWHSVVYNKVPPVTLFGLRYNMVWDGLFLAVTWLVMAAGLILLWHSVKRAQKLCPTSVLTGAFATGWGLFNVIEGLVNHHLLQLHHLHPGPNEQAWDIGFVVVGAAAAAVGSLVVLGGRAKPLESLICASTELKNPARQH
ncbi:MAG: DUF2243 domain-containing protein [Deltaproteobacteria bacterium]|nr:DUF2243 domain-containing protein [Deltaproteobacteria bacterium]